VFQIRSGMTLVWTSLWGCLWLTASIIQFGWLWIDSPNLLTSYPWTLTTTSRSMMKSVLLVCYVCMEFQRRLSLVEGPSLLLTFGSNCTHPSGLTWFTVQPITHRRIVKQRVNQILKDMLRACVMEYPGSWDKNLPWAEFLYNNSYQESLKLAPFEALYGRQCRTPLN
jgi:hypothetical protein